VRKQERSGYRCVFSAKAYFFFLLQHNSCLLSLTLQGPTGITDCYHTVAKQAELSCTQQ